ncbi:hypothetical protein AAES_28868 [Amazona aestiva]|uniref:G-protein coupled receptors family 1 profile domain-containing protein n=1 Tax=Amazona aestiva TaxID=12930 RepID=A0A0Q3U2E3_AMAAE|nr:hypothetical protein AAES_28868 [Amazona aestiva]
MMAYDRHVAICQPLLYVTIISSRVCWQLVASSYLFAFLTAVICTCLHTPMYFFLTHLAFTDICYSTVISPRMLADLLSEDKTISFSECMMQFLTFIFFATIECHLLAMMAYDRHMAICQPLLYVSIISSHVCWQLVATSYLFIFLSAIICTWYIYGGTFCGPNRIDHFFCDFVPVLKLVCSDTHSSEMVIFAFVTINVFLIFAFFATIECHLLAMMAYDRHIAICQPLLYASIISSHVCWQLVASSYLFAFLSAIICTWSIYGGTFCGPNHIDHFFCDFVPVLKLVCSDTHSSEMVIFAFVTINIVGMSVITVLSYISILHTVLRMCSAQSRARAFHTCASHLMSVALLYGTAFFMYLQPPSSHRSLDKVASIFYALINPMLNPFIYTLRNKEVKGALVKCGRRFFNHWQHKTVLSLRT